MKMKILNLIALLGVISLVNVSCKKNAIDDEIEDISHLIRPTPSAGSGSGNGQGKEVYLPSYIWDVPTDNDFNSNDGKYSYSRRVESSNFALFWDKEFGDDFVNSSGVDLPRVFSEMERSYDYYANILKFVEVGNSLTDQYKMLCFVRGGTDGNAYGGGAMDSIGVIWMPLSSFGYDYLTMVAHEVGHAFQYMVHADGAWGFSSNSSGSQGQSIWEMTSQFMAMLMFPEWMTIENYQLVSFMDNTHLAFLHEDNRYTSPYVLIDWTNRHGLDFVGKIWRQAVSSEDPAATYKRILNINQSQFNDEMFDAARRFMTWDIALIRPTEVNKYANQHHTKFNNVGNGWYRISPEKCPQNYGYNGAKLIVPSAGTTVSLNFKGIAGSSGYRAINVDKAGWRYGFVAYKNDGTRVYSDTFSANEGDAEFIVPEGTTHLWLVVSGAPTEHWEHLWDDNANNDEQWPYEIRLTGTSLDAAMVN